MTAVQPNAQTANQPPTGPPSRFITPSRPVRSEASRPLAAWRCETSIWSPPTTVLTATMAMLRRVITTMNGT